MKRRHASTIRHAVRRTEMETDTDRHTDRARGRGIGTSPGIVQSLMLNNRFAGSAPNMLAPGSAGYKASVSKRSPIL